MPLRTFLTINAVLAFLYGLAFLLVPAVVVTIFEVAKPSPNVDLNLQFFGSALLGVGVLLWFAKDFQDWQAIRGVLIANAVLDAAGLVINLRGHFLGLMNHIAWSSSVVYLLLLAASLYYLQKGKLAA
jgi:hypothetical protein